jgi:hypothetical protein
MFPAWPLAAQKTGLLLLVLFTCAICPQWLASGIIKPFSQGFDFAGI